MSRTTSKPGAIHKQIIEIMQRFPDGITSGQIRRELEKGGLRAEDQTHLDRRKRDLYKWFEIQKTTRTEQVDGKSKKVQVYKLLGERTTVTDQGEISQRVRAEILHRARGRCQQCGETVENHFIRLVVDHKRPRDWGGSNDPSNLWALCDRCNAGKKAFFDSLNADSETMKRAMSHSSVHVRIGELLKAVGVGKRTPSDILEVVADQDDWHKRLRELRYPVIGWEIGIKSFKAKDGRKKVDYILEKWRAWPENPTALIRSFERDREARNRSKSRSKRPQETGQS
jgi:hypothetical protein